MGRRRRAALSVGAAALMAAAGCSDSGDPAPASARGSARPSPPAAPVAVLDREVVLGCEDAGTGAGDPGAVDLRVGGAAFENLRTRIEDVPRGADVGLTMPAGLAGWRFRKAPVYLAAGAPAVTVRLGGGDGDAALAWVASGVWTSGRSPVLEDWLAGSVTFEGCPDRPSVYFGGLAAAGPGTCVALSFETATGREQRPQRLDGGPCE